MNPIEAAGGAKNGDYTSRYEIVTPGARSAAVTGLFNSAMGEVAKAEAAAAKEAAAKDGGEEKEKGGKEEPVSPNPGHANMALQKFERAARKTELRFGERVPYERFPNWILPGSEPILPKPNADLNMWDDELDLKGNFHYMANYNPDREMYVQIPDEDENIQVDAEEMARVRAEVRANLQHKLRSFLYGPNAANYPYDKFPNVILPGSEPVMH